MEKKEVKIITYRESGTQRIYSNYARVNVNPFEVTLQFADVKPGANDEEHKKTIEKGSIEVSIDIEIVVRPDIALEIVEVLQKQLAKIKVDKK